MNRSILMLAVVLVGGGCEAIPASAERGEWVARGKADDTATCEDACGGQAAAGCWCDESCVAFGDCCPDVELVCNGAVGLDPSHLGAGAPGCSGTFLDKDFLSLCHEDDWLIAAWTAHFLTAEDLANSTDRTDDFRADPELPDGDRAELADYKGSGFDRGHMAPAGDFVRSREAMSSTFVLSNMAPQTPQLNRGMWNRLETDFRDTITDHGRGWIFTGNLFLDDNGEPTEPSVRLGANEVAVPTHCFKMLLLEDDDGTHSLHSFILQNQDESLPGDPADYRVSTDEVERLTGFDFFAALGDAEETDLERAVAVWPPPAP